jgi:hypothetical protein
MPPCKTHVTEMALPCLVEFSGVFHDGVDDNMTMSHRKRLYDTALAEHLEHHRQMALVTGPRQVGKTTACRGLSSAYLNWGNADDRQTILQGPAATADLRPVA